MQRCFLGGVPFCVAEGVARSSEQTGIESKPLPDRYSDGFYRYQPLTLRLMGTLVHLCRPQTLQGQTPQEHRQRQPLSLSLDTQNQKPHASTQRGDNVGNNEVEDSIGGAHVVDDRQDALVQVYLDDGTGVLSIQTTGAMIAQIRLQIGMTLECIVVQQPSPHRDDDTVSHVWMALQLIVVHDIHAEALRWFELTFRKSVGLDWHPSPTSVLTTSTVSMKWGFPSRTVSSDDILGIIDSESRSCATEDNTAKLEPSSTGATGRNSTSHQPMGVSATDLAECLDLSLEQVEFFIQELQTKCQVYRNEHGRFISL